MVLFLILKEKLDNKDHKTTVQTNADLKVWESPQLFVENMETITEGGGAPGGSGDDGFYQS